MRLLEMQEKINKMSFVFQIMALKVVHELRHVPTGILIIGSQCVNKQW